MMVYMYVSKHLHSCQSLNLRYNIITMKLRIPTTLWTCSEHAILSRRFNRRVKASTPNKHPRTHAQVTNKHSSFVQHIPLFFQLKFQILMYITMRTVIRNQCMPPNHKVSRIVVLSVRQSGCS